MNDENQERSVMGDMMQEQTDASIPADLRCHMFWVVELFQWPTIGDGLGLIGLGEISLGWWQECQSDFES